MADEHVFEGSQPTLTIEEWRAWKDHHAARKFKIAAAYFDPEMTRRLERAAKQFRLVAQDRWDAGRLVVEALEARLDALEVVER